MTKRVYYLTLTSVLVALGVIDCSLFEFTVGVAKVAAIQHLIKRYYQI